MKVESMLPISHSQDEINPVGANDYVGEDGLIVCGVCGRRKQYRVVFGSLKKVVPCICKCREEELERKKEQDEYEQRMYVINRLKDASMMASKYRDASFSRYRIRKENQRAYKLAVNYINRFSEMRKKNQGLLLYGPVGTGKSYTAACIANALMEKRVPVVMTSFVKILQDIQGNVKESDYIQILNSASLLIIDDLGTENLTPFVISQLFHVINSRDLSRKTTIISTNLSPEELQSTYTERISSRLMGQYTPIPVFGEDLRNS